MTINHLPAIKAFCEERIRQAKIRAPYPNPHAEEVRLARIDELQLVITLCDGLAKQQELLTQALISPPR